MNHLSRRLSLLVASAAVAALTAGAGAGAEEGPGHRMMWDHRGMVMGENRGDALPINCTEISGDHAFTVRVGREHATDGFVFGYTEHDWHVPPCSRVSVTLINDDNVRHMWMLHGLPSYLYYQGMFHLEVEGGETLTGTFIVPQVDTTYLVHCDIAQHTEKGLKGQLRVGDGGGMLPGIPGLTDPTYTGAGG
uniref:Plastocyanin-like domain-containing protein n=1 Tax=Haliea sp. ETY-M TaxID=1055105 RepID=A0A455R1Z2_9GAMM|nr:hypothetical protein [Haliea sp. ETY-M]